MGKININATIKSEEEILKINTSAIKSNNKIIYTENDKKVTILIFENKIEIKRVSPDYEINLVLEKNKKTISTYKIFGGSKVFDLETNTKKLNIEKNKIEINYILEGNTFNYLLEMEDI